MIHPNIAALIVFAAAGLTGCSDVSNPAPGVGEDGTLAACPASPNCRCSDATDEDHRIAPLAIEGDADAAWAALNAHIDEQSRMTVIRREPDYLHVEARTALLRFTDDVEFHLRPDAGVIAMRSASRVGYSDLGANRKRLEKIRAALAARGVVKAGS